MPIPWRPRLYVTAGLEHKPQVHGISQAVRLDPDAVVGKLIRVWLEFQEKATDDGLLPAKVPDWLDLLVGCPRFAAAMATAGWLIIESGGLRIPDFDAFVSKKAIRRYEKTMWMAKARLTGGATDADRETPEVSTSGPHPVHNCPHEVHKVPVAAPVPVRQAAKPDGLFDRFWSAYPNKKGKADAVKAWAKLKPDEPLLLKMLEAIRVQSLNPRWSENGGQYIPYPATWLNGRRWEDEPAQPGRPVQSGPRIKSKSGEFERFRSRGPDGPAPAERDAQPWTSLFDDQDA